MDPENEDIPQYEHIYQNEFSYRKHKKQKEEDIAICECKFDFSDPDSACGERCLNVLTSTECTPGYCPCGVYCKNQVNAVLLMTTLFKTEGRGWGLLAAENLKAGQFIIEYCGEVISWKEAKRRSQAYENHGLKDAYIISLNASESIDATKKGSLARFINHSCQPNCETRKWTVLGEIRVGIFAKQDILIGSELAYDYNFEWYGGAKVRCLCGAPNCSGFLGAKSRGFQSENFPAKFIDRRIPIYGKTMMIDFKEIAGQVPDKGVSKEAFKEGQNYPKRAVSQVTRGQQIGSMLTVPFQSFWVRQSEVAKLSAFFPGMAEDEPATKLLKAVDSNSENDANIKTEPSITVDVSVKSEQQLESTVDPVPMEGVVVTAVKTESSEEINLYSQDAQQAFSQKNAMISRIRTHILSVGGELKNEAACQLASVYDEIRPAIEEHERDSQDSVATSVAEKWIEASCSKLRIEFDFHSSILKNIVCSTGKAYEQVKPSELEEGGNDTNEVKLLEY
ncbi:hypothetical protein COLO4_13799 [Corchorus olitorius]|uniref:SET domain-containing protein n=1 Tax=Corchorus olitorius TaxID=93759 RepID=A0A1R3JUK7_9ROSI|nr:hypothetical protein COLO4_13799 [Corchorus olitorius]